MVRGHIPVQFVPVFKMCQISYRQDRDVQKLLETKAPIPEGRTLRVIVPTNIEGERLRLTFQNPDVVRDGWIDEVTVAQCDETGVIDPSTTTAVRVGGASSFAIAAGGSAVSDEVCYTVKPGAYLAISVYTQRQPFCGNYFLPYVLQSPPGNHCGENFSDTAFSARDSGTILDEPRVPYLALVEAATASEPNVVVCFGDSITQQGYWYSVFLKNLYRAHPGKVCVLNAGIGGNRLVRDSSPVVGGTFGKAGICRLDEDVLQVPGVTHMTFALGVNDVMHGNTFLDQTPPPSIEEFTAGCHQVAQACREHGIQTMAFTVYPATLSENPEYAAVLKPLYDGYNRGIRNAGFDSVLELEPLLGESGQQRYKDGLCQEDGLHINAAGGTVLAEAMDLRWFA